MKKRFFLSLIAAIVLTFSASAQNNNTYSMVLTLANGTTVTIGPNELQNISFNNGEVNFSGQSIENLVESVNANKANIEMHSAQIERVESLAWGLKKQHEAEVYELSNRLKENIEMLLTKIKDLEAMVDKLSSGGE